MMRSEGDIERYGVMVRGKVENETLREDWLAILMGSVRNCSTVCVSLTEPYSPVCKSHAVVLLNWREGAYDVRTLWTVKYSWTLSSWWSKVTCHTKYHELRNSPLFSIWQHYPVAVCVWYTGQERAQNAHVPCIIIYGCVHWWRSNNVVNTINSSKLKWAIKWKIGYGFMCAFCVCLCMCMCVHLCECARACVYTYQLVCVSMWMCASHDVVPVKIIVPLHYMYRRDGRAVSSTKGDSDWWYWGVMRSEVALRGVVSCWEVKCNGERWSRMRH